MNRQKARGFVFGKKDWWKMEARRYHPQMRIRHGKITAKVDKVIAPLIVELWKAGWTTWQSCQRHSGPMERT